MTSDDTNNADARTALINKYKNIAAAHNEQFERESTKLSNISEKDSIPAFVRNKAKNNNQQLESLHSIKKCVSDKCTEMTPHIINIAGTAISIAKNTKNNAKMLHDKANMYLQEHKDEIEQGRKIVNLATNKAAKSIFQLISDTVNYKQNKERLERQKARIEQQSEEYNGIANNLSSRRMVDSIFVGGDLLGNILRTGASADVHAAYEAAYPEQSQHISFEDYARTLPDDQLNGIVSAVKGKLFEMQYVKYLNDGNLPEGYSAELAHSATQPGWDIAIHGPNGHIAEVLQLKATDSVSYVHEAIKHYPSIDIVTTDEVYSHLLMNEASDHSSNIIDSHISNTHLTDCVIDSVDSSFYHMHWTPPIISLAMIAFTAYTLKDADAYEKASHFGSRAGRSYLTYLIGGGVMAITQTWWLGMLAGIGSRYFAVKITKSRDICDDLEDIIARNDIVLSKLRSSI